jgi:ubiquinone/menaquinone biosynthesis C-methylase UbiE
MSTGNRELNGFLRTINLMNDRYDFYKGRERKFIQIREYEKQIASLLKKMSKKRPLTFIDCGAGSCYLSFYLNHMNRNREIHFTCIDYNSKLMERAASTAKALGYTNMDFIYEDIMAYVPE